MTIITADENGSGTDCQVSFELFGSSRISEHIDVPKKSERFERGREDEVKLEFEDLGTLVKMRVKVDGKGERSEWLMKEARVLNTVTGDKYVFRCNEWLGKGPNAKGKLSYDIPAVLRGETQIKMTNYSVIIRTTDKTHAGTGANVALEIFGDKGNSGEIPLKKPKSGQKPFQRGSVDEFNLKLLNMGNLQKIRIQHDDSGFGSGWHLQDVEITESKENFTFKFVCNKWLSKSDDDKQIIREIPCSNPRTPESSRKGKHTYEFKIITGDKKDAGMIHNCWLVLNGETGNTDAIYLKNESRTNFKKGETAHFERKIKSVGDLNLLQIGAYARDEDRFNERAEGRINEWYCHSVIVTDSHTGDEYNFICKNWISITKYPKKKYVIDCVLRKKKEGTLSTNQPGIRKWFLSCQRLFFLSDFKKVL